MDLHVIPEVHHQTLELAHDRLSLMLDAADEARQEARAVYCTALVRLLHDSVKATVPEHSVLRSDVGEHTITVMTTDEATQEVDEEGEDVEGG